VETAGSGADAFHKAKDLQPVLVLLDMELDGKSGWEILHELKTSPETRSIPVIIASAADEGKMGAALGAVESLTKPLTGTALIGAVRGVLQPEGALRVLIVDDDPETRELLTDTLVNEGHTPLTARYAAEALHILSTSRVDAIVLDLILPGRSGFEVLGDIRADQRLRGLPVLVVTVKDLTQREEEALLAQGAHIFAKAWRSTWVRFWKLRTAARRSKRFASPGPTWCCSTSRCPKWTAMRWCGKSGATLH